MVPVELTFAIPLKARPAAANELQIEVPVAHATDLLKEKRDV
jgi:hypothetical protein